MLHKKWSASVLIIFLLVGFTATAHAQLETLIERYTGENAKAYVEPLVTAFGANLNSGIYNSAKVPQSGLHLYFGLNAMVAFFSSSQKTFTGTTEGYFTPIQSVETATIVGKEGAVVTGDGGTEFRFSDGYDLKSFLVGTPTITVGSLYGTEGTIRYFSQHISEDLGKITLFGIGGRHSISQYFPLMPIDIAAGVFYHRFKIGNIIRTDDYLIHAEAGKSLSILDLYFGLGYGWNKAHVEYTFNALGEEQDIAIDIKGKNNFRGRFGFGLNLLMLHLSADYNFGQQNVVQMSVAIGL